MVLRSSGYGGTSPTLTSLRCVFVLAFHQHRADFVAPAGQVLRGEPQAADGRGGARDRDPAEGVGQQPGHRLHVLVFQVDAEQLAEFGRGQPGRDPGRTVGEPLHRRLFVVVLVGDLADDLFQDVLDRDQPGGTAVLVDHDGHVATLRLHLAEQLVDRLAVRYVAGRADYRGDLSGRPALLGRGARVLVAPGHDVLQVGDAHHVVLVLADHGNPGEAAAQR